MKLARYLKPYWLWALLAPLAMVGEVLFDLFQLKLMSSIIDEGVLGNNMGVILSTGLLMLLFVAIGGLCGIGSAAFSSVASQRFGNDLRSGVFGRVMHLSFEQTDKFTTGSLITRLTNDVTAVMNFVSMVLRMFVRAPFMFVGGIVMALSLNVNFGLILIVSLPVQIAVIFFIFRKANPMFKIVQQKLDKVNGTLRENILGARIIKSLVREKSEIEKFRGANDDLVDKSYRVQRLMSIMQPCLMIIMNLSVVAIIYIGGLQVEARALQVGQIMAAVSYITQILMSMMMVSMMFQSISRAKASSDRILEVLDTEPAVKNGALPADLPIETIEFDNVSFSYPSASGVPAVRNVSFTIKAGETLAILGATGSGKTSLVSLIPRFYDTTEGTVRINGTDVREYDLASLRDRIGFVLQKSEIFSGTIVDNILYGLQKGTREEAVEAARIAQAEEYIGKFNDGYETVIGEKGASLSGGQKQRLAIARAVAKKPELLIFDDSTSALDFRTEAKLRTALNESLAGATVVIIAQRIASVIHADRIAVLDNGALAALGTHDELMETSALYQDIYHSQIRNGGVPKEGGVAV